MRIHDWLSYKPASFFVGQQHDLDSLGKDYASGGLIGESGFIDGTNRTVKGFGAAEVRHGKVDEYQFLMG